MLFLNINYFLSFFCILQLFFFSLVSASASASSATSENHCTGKCLQDRAPFESPRMYGLMEQKRLYWAEEAKEGKIGAASSTGPASCVDGFAGEYPCHKINLQAFVSLTDLGSLGQGNDIWGWTDANGNEYAIAGCRDGTSFVDVTDPSNPIVLGFLPTSTESSTWRDIKVFKDYAYIGSEALNHGLQVFDLSQLTTASMEYRKKTSQVKMAPRDIAKDGHVKLNMIFNATALYTEFGSSHNIVINEDSGFLYAVGSKTCAGGLHIVDIHDPANPTFAGCFADDGYTHDAQCVNYVGPDSRYIGHEICFNYNEDTLTIVDVSIKSSPHLLARYSYQGHQYTHQGWLNKEQSHLLLDDELDEQRESSLDGHTRTLIWDVSALDTPALIGNFYSSERAIDHNQYIHNGLSYQANYCAGLRVLDASKITTGELSQVAYFDVAPDCSDAVFSGSWSVYPYFASGTIIVQSIERGLFVVTHQ